jgi:transposase
MQKLTGVLAGQKNRLHKVLSDAGIRLSVVVSDLNGKAAQAMIKGLLDGETPEQLLRHAKLLKAPKEDIEEALSGDLSSSHRFVVTEIMAMIADLEASIAKCRQQLQQGLAEYQSILLNLQTIPGIDEAAAATLLVEIGDDMEVFGSSKRLASWAGVCPGNHESAGKRQSGRTRKGNHYLRRILCEIANSISRTRCSLRDKFKGLAARRGRKRAIFAIAHKVLKIAFLLIKKGECYQPSQQDYEALAVKRNAPRWIKLLKQQGFIVKKAEHAAQVKA